jgi:hypothetical protein
MTPGCGGIVTIVLFVLLLVGGTALVGCGGEEATPEATVYETTHANDPIRRDVLEVLVTGTGLTIEAIPGDDTVQDAMASPMHVGGFAQDFVAVQAERLAEMRPSDAAKIEANAEAYLAKLAALDEYGRAVLARVPEDYRLVRDPQLSPLQSYGLGVDPSGVELESELLLAPEGDGIEGTYLGMMDHNFTMIAKDLGAPGIDIHGHTGQLTLGHDHDH